MNLGCRCLLKTKLARAPWVLSVRHRNMPIGCGQRDIIKEDISHYCETAIDHSQLSYQEKEEQKRQMKQNLEVYIQGVKDEMRAKGRLV